MKTSKLRLQRAQEHINQLDSEIGDFLKSDSYEITRQRETHPIREDVFYFHVLKPMPAERYGMLIGDCLHNLRSALDNLVWDLAPTTVKQDKKKAGGLQFPIFDDPKSYAARAPHYLAGIGSTVQALVDKHQPYKRPQPSGHPLSRMAQLTNWDKHRFIQPCFWLLYRTTIITAGFGRATIAPRFTADRLDDGCEFLRVRIIEGPDSYHDPDFTIDVSFDRAGPAGGQPVRDGLREFHYYIERALLPDFEPFF